MTKVRYQLVHGLEVAALGGCGVIGVFAPHPSVEYASSVDEVGWADLELEGTDAVGSYDIGRHDRYRGCIGRGDDFAFAVFATDRHLCFRCRGRTTTAVHVHRAGRSLEREKSLGIRDRVSEERAVKVTITVADFGVRGCGR